MGINENGSYLLVLSEISSQTKRKSISLGSGGGCSGLFTATNLVVLKRNSKSYEVKEWNRKS